MNDLYAQYYEDLLGVQYKISETIQQKLPRGTIREDFLRDIVLERRKSFCGNKGIVENSKLQSGECDIIFYDGSAAITPLGDLISINPKYCKLILEVKSNATGKDFKKTNNNFKIIKEIDSDNKPSCGLFCYNIAMKKETLLKRFGFVYNKDIDGWEENIDLDIEYKNIDFIICIACLEDEESRIEEQFFLSKDRISGRFSLILDFPIIKNFFGITDNL